MKDATSLMSVLRALRVQLRRSKLCCKKEPMHVGYRGEVVAFKRAIYIVQAAMNTPSSNSNLPSAR